MACVTIFLATVAAGASAPAPDISINAQVRAREVKIEQQGRANARVAVVPSAGERVEVQRNLPRGQRRYRNLELKLDVEARLADPNGPGVNAAASAQNEPQTGD